MNSKDYWLQREAEQLKHNITDEAEYDRQLKQIYQNMLDACQKEIDSFYGKYAAAEGISIAEAKKRVAQHDVKAFERKAKKYVKDKDFSKKANEELRLYNATMKINRLEMLKANIGLETIAGHDEMQKFMEGVLKGRTEAELKRQAGILGKTVKNNAQLANAIVNGSFHNGTFSDRIWQYQDIMRQDLGRLLQQGLIQGKGARVIAKDLKKYWYGNDPKTGGGATYCMERLMRTELARVQTEAQKQSFERNGFEMYQFICNVNPTKHGTCPVCRRLANEDKGLGKGVYLVKDMMPGTNAPPMHPHCRCSTAAYEDDAEYEAWLDFLDKGGTTAEWNETGKKEWKKLNKVLENSGNDATMKAEASVLPNRFKKYLPNSERRLEIIEEGKNLEKPIFASGLLGQLAQQLEPEPGFYDVVLHGYPYGLEYFGEKIDVETLCAIIAQRKDYHKGTNIRLIACQAGAKADGVAQYIADKLRVTVVAPDKLGIVERKLNGKTIVYSGSASGVHDGEMKPFSPQDEVKR